MNFVRNSDDISEDSTSVRTDSKSATYVYIPVTDNTTISVPTEEALTDDIFETQSDSSSDNEPNFTFPDYPISNVDPTDFRIYNEQIKLSKRDIQYLIEHFQRRTIAAEHLKHLLEGPYKKEKVLEMLQNWWPEHEFVTDDLDNYKYQNNNDWLFSIISTFNTKLYHFILEKYFPNHLLPERLPPLTSFTELFTKDYRKHIDPEHPGVLVGEFVHDLRNSVACINTAKTMYIIREHDGTVTFISKAEFKQKMKEIQLEIMSLVQNGKKTKTMMITGWDIINSFGNSKYIMFDSMKFYSSDPRTYSIFQGYSYANVPLRYCHFEVVQFFLDHMKRMICNNNDELYTYLLFWIASLVQHPEKKNGTALIIVGEPGTGKNSFTDAICTILKPYANDNAKLELFTSTFNSSIRYKKLVVCNEVRSYSSNKNYDHDTLKTLITEETIDLHQKYVDVKHTENVSDFIFLSNNPAPIKIEQNDRRFVVFETSPACMNDERYFKNFYSKLTHSFYRELYNYFRHLKITDDWNPRKIPETEARRRMQEYSKGHIWHFLKENYDSFTRGIQRSEAFALYRTWCKQNNYTTGTMQEFKLGLLQFCVETRPSKSSSTNRPILYKFKVDWASEFRTANDE